MEPYLPLRKSMKLDPYKGSLPPFEVVQKSGSLRGIIVVHQGD